RGATLFRSPLTPYPTHLRQRARFTLNTTSTPELYTLSLHDALPISSATAWLSASISATALSTRPAPASVWPSTSWEARAVCSALDRKSTRLNSSHVKISYAVFCLKKKKINQEKQNIKDMQGIYRPTQ